MNTKALGRTGFILLLSFFLCLFAAGEMAQAEARVTLKRDVTASTVPAGTTLHFTLTGTEVQAVKLMVVTPDSRQQFISGEQCAYTLSQPGFYVFVAYGLSDESETNPANALCMSRMMYVTAEGEIKPNASADACVHDYVQRVTLLPTCVKEGNALFVCSICGDSYTETIPATGHGRLKISSVHPHREAYCEKCGKEITDSQNVERILSDCPFCFSQGIYTQERALDMAQICLDTYDMDVFFGENYNEKTYHHVMANAYGIGDSKQKTIIPDSNGIEALFLTDITDDGKLILTISLQGSMDLYDWLADVLQTGANIEGIHYKFDQYVWNLITKTIENGNIRIPIDLKKNGYTLEGNYSISKLLTMVKTQNNTHIRITGHSMGGSLAQILTYRLLNDYNISPKKIETYTFAALPPFTKLFANTFEKAYPDANIYNYIHIKDFAPDVGVTYGIGSGIFGTAVDNNTRKSASVYTSKAQQSIISLCLTTGILTIDGINNILQSGVNVLLSDAGGETLTGSDIGTIILLNSEMSVGLINGDGGHVHYMSVYYDLIKNFEIYDAGNFDYVLGACESYLETFNDVSRVYGTAVKIDGKWYADALLPSQNYHELLRNWNTICDSIKKLNPRVEDVGLINRSAIIGWAGGTNMAGDMLIENGRILLNKAYTIDVIERFIDTKSADYNRIFNK